MATFFGLLPAVVIMVFAQMGRRSRVFAVFTYVSLVLFDLLLLTAAAGTEVMARQAVPLTWPLEGQQISISAKELHTVAEYLGLSGILALLLLIPFVQSALSRLLSIRPGDPVHVTALSFSAYLIAFSITQRIFLDALARAGVTMTMISAQDLIGQALALILLALFGAGWIIQHSTRETLRRLKVTWPRWREIKVAVGTALGLLLMQSFLGLVWMALSPESIEEVEDLSQMLLGGLFNPWGALLIGVAAGLSEELVFRGALQPRFGLLLTSILFALMHSQYILSFAMLVVFLLGLVLGIVRNKVNTTAAILTHALYNTVLVLIAIYAPNLSP